MGQALLDVGPLSPHPAAAPLATDAALSGAIQVLEFDAWDAPQNVARLVIDVVVLAQEARVVVGHLLGHAGAQVQLAIVHQVGQQLGVVLNRKRHVAVLVLEGVETVRRDRDHAAGLKLAKDRVVLFDHRLKAFRLADALDLVGAAHLVHAHGAKVDSHPLEHGGQGAGHRLDAGIVGRTAADVE